MKKTKSPFVEKTVVLIKPDGVKRGLVGEIISKFEKTGFKIIALKMVWIDEGFASKHYVVEREEWVRGMGEKTLKTYAEYGKDPQEELGTKDPLTIGKMVAKWNLEFLSSGPVVAILLDGVHAITNVRKIVGATVPSFAEAGTIRGMYSVDSPAQANATRRAVHNLVHASGNSEEAKYEEELWFHKNEIHDYHRVDEEIMFG